MVGIFHGPLGPLSPTLFLQNGLWEGDAPPLHKWEVTS